MNASFVYWYSMCELWKDAPLAERRAYYLGLEWAMNGDPTATVESWQSPEAPC